MSQTQQSCLGEFKLNLTAEPHKDAEVQNGRPKRPVFKILNKYNQIHLRVYTGVANDKNKGTIEGNMSFPVFHSLIELISDVATPEWPAGKRVGVTCENFTYPNGKRSEKPEIISTAYVGKSKDGVVYIALLAPQYQNRPMIQFFFDDDEYHHMVDAEGKPLSREEVSMRLARGYARSMGQLVTIDFANVFMTREQIEAAKEAGRQNRGGGGGGNWNKGGSGGGNNNWNKGNNSNYNKGGDSAPAAGLDEDIPF